MDTFIIITLVALLAAAGMAWLARKLPREEADRSPPVDPLAGSELSREDCLLLIREHYVGQGFSLRENPTGGADFEIERGGERQLVDFVDENEVPAGEQLVREFHAVVVKRGVASGILVSAGRFTPQARLLADSRHIDLIDGARLQRLVEAARDQDGELTAPRPADDDSTVPRRVVLCPLCGRVMLKRYERVDGENRPYFGCARAPACKGRRDFA